MIAVDATRRIQVEAVSFLTPTNQIQDIHTKMFTGVRSSILKFDTSAEDASRLWGSIAKTVDQASKEIIDPGARFGILWEPNESAENCRECQVKFQLLKSKHH